MCRIVRSWGASPTVRATIGDMEVTDVNEQKAIKVYVQVAAVFTEDGLMLPRYLVWEDGVRYKIDRVSDIKQAAAMRCGGQGDRYTIYVNGKQSYLYFERSCSLTGNNLGRWFVERRVAS